MELPKTCKTMGFYKTQKLSIILFRYSHFVILFHYATKCKQIEWNQFSPWWLS